MKRFLSLFIFTGLLFGQETVKSSSIDTFSQLGMLEKVIEQAKMYAKENFIFIATGKYKIDKLIG